MQRDGWWMDGIERKPGEDPHNLPRDMRGPFIIMALIALADAMVWQVAPGLSLVVMSLTVTGAACQMAQTLSPERVITAGVMAFLAVAPAIELVQPLSLFLLFVGLSASLCIIAGISRQDLLRAMRRYPFVAARATWRDAHARTRRAGGLMPQPSKIRDIVLAWAVPLGLGLVFGLLFIGANPVLDRFVANLTSLQAPDFPVSRIMFWVVMGLFFWAALIAHRLHDPLSARRSPRQLVKRPGLINAGSVTRSIVLFNALFAAQTLSDLFYLYGSNALPDGLTYAQYAHRGAYPLLVTALLAGVFAVLARPFTDDNKPLRLALILWLIQTLALVVASATRLEIYVDVYGLSRLRVAAAIWMAVVAAGLCLVIWQVRSRHRTTWMLQRSALLGLAALYCAAFINIDGLIGRYNLTRAVKLDQVYLCGLSQAVLDPIARYGYMPETFCNWNGEWHGPVVTTPRDWREWGFRNARLRSSLATLNSEINP